jgi:hypothetical protein
VNKNRKDLFPWLSNQKISGIILIYFIVENLFEIYSNRRKKKTKRVTWQAGFFFVKIYTISSTGSGEAGGGMVGILTSSLVEGVSWGSGRALPRATISGGKKCSP